MFSRQVFVIPTFAHPSIILYLLNEYYDRLSITILGVWYMYKPSYLKHWVHFVLLLSIGIKDFHFLPLVKNIKARVTTLSKQTNKQWRNVQIKQTIKKKKTNKQGHNEAITI